MVINIFAFMVSQSNLTGQRMEDRASPFSSALRRFPRFSSNNGRWPTATSATSSFLLLNGKGGCTEDRRRGNQKPFPLPNPGGPGRSPPARGLPRNHLAGRTDHLRRACGVRSWHRAEVGMGAADVKQAKRLAARPNRNRCHAGSLCSSRRPADRTPLGTAGRWRRLLFWAV